MYVSENTRNVSEIAQKLLYILEITRYVSEITITRLTSHYILVINWTHYHECLKKTIYSFKFLRYTVADRNTGRKNLNLSLEEEEAYSIEG